MRDDGKIGEKNPDETTTMRPPVRRALVYAIVAALLGIAVGTLRASPAAGMLLGLAVGVGVLGGIALFELVQRVR